MRIAKIMPDASYSLSKMLYTLKNAERPVWKFLFVAGYICFRLCGNAVSDISLASRSLLYDVDGRCWSKELMDAAGIEESMLPQVLPTGSIAGTILPGAASELGLPKDVKIVIGSHDQIVDAAGTERCEITDADKCADYMARTGVDMVVANLGTEHRASGKTLHYHSDAACAIREKIGHSIVLHGTSSVSLKSRTVLKRSFSRRVRINSAVFLPSRTYRTFISAPTVRINSSISS